MEHCGLRSRLFCLQGRRSPEWTKTPKLQRSDLNRYDSPCIGTVFSLLLCITKIHDPLISGFEPYYKFPTFAFATEINCCVGHISCVQDTFLWTRFLDHVSYLILPKVSRFSFEIENVGLEPLLCVPNAACFSLHHILSNPSGNRTRASGATVRCTGRYTMELYILLVSKHRKSRLSFRTSGSLSINHCDLSGYPVARTKAPGPRHPLDPVLWRRTQISPSACIAVGIIVPWRSNRRYVFLILFVYICSIAFPFRTYGPFLLLLI